MIKVFESLNNQKRDLKVGIIGRVKAGKSSLLNALLFDGKDVLPKAATPMTAALTEISYGETLSAEVDFFTDKDISEIKNNAAKYLSEFNELVQKEKKEIIDKKKKKNKPINDLEIAEIAKRKAKKALDSKLVLSASYDQSERMKQSGLNVSDLSNHQNIKTDSLENLGKELLDFVGSKGRFMPFTKSVKINLPIESLKGLNVIDTPGVNDPVQSREARTCELLKYCDVIFIVSPAGQFISKEDTELMDRISTKDGIREIFVIASKVDDQIMSSEKDRYNGILPDVIAN